MGGVPFLKRHPVLHPLNGGVLLALFLCVAPLLSPEIDSHREGLGESLGAAVCKCRRSRSRYREGFPFRSSPGDLTDAGVFSPSGRRG